MKEVYMLSYINISDSWEIVGIYETLEDAETVKEYIENRVEFYYDEDMRIYYQHLEIEKVPLNRMIGYDWKCYERKEHK